MIKNYKKNIQFFMVYIANLYVDKVIIIKIKIVNIWNVLIYI